MLSLFYLQTILQQQLMTILTTQGCENQKQQTGISPHNKQQQLYQNGSQISEGQNSTVKHYDGQQISTAQNLNQVDQNQENYQFYNEIFSLVSTNAGQSSSQQQLQNNKQSGQRNYIDQSCGFDQSDPHQFKAYVDFLQKNGTSSFMNVWNQTKFSNKLKFILQNWHQFSYQYLDPLKIFASFVKERIQCIPIYKDFFPGLKQITDKINKKVQYNIKTVQPNIRLQRQNIIYGHYLKEQQTKAQQLGHYFIQGQGGVKQQLGEYIVKNNMYQEGRQNWQQMFFEGAALKRYNIDAVTHQDAKKQCQSIYNFADLLLNNHEMVQPSQLICCARFFYYQFNISPLVNNNLICRQKMPNLKNKVNQLMGLKQDNNKTNISTHKGKDQKSKQQQAKQKLKAEKDYKDELRETMLDVCALLNSGGGVLLFFTEHRYLQIWPLGQSLLQAKKQHYRKLIIQAMGDLYPKVSIGKQITISFVPVVRNPYESGYRIDALQNQEKAVNRLYIQGLYVPRITVVPSQAQKLYYYQKESNVQSAIIQNRRRINLNGQQMLLQMKKKFEYYYVSDLDCNGNQQTRQLLSKEFTITDKYHKCPSPYPGVPMMVQEPAKLDANNNFKYMSMMVAHRNSYPEISQKLHNKGIENEIFYDFQSLGFKSSSSSVPIFHNMKFEQLLKTVAYSKEFQFNGKYLLVIMVTPYIKLLDRTGKDPLPDSECKKLQGWVDKKFVDKGDVVQQFRFINEDNQVEYYVKTKDRLSTMFIYYIMHQGGQKVIFKNPKNFDKIPPEQQDMYWSILYPKK